MSLSQALNQFAQNLGRYRNDFLMAYLCLDLQRFKTLSIAIQYLKGGYGSVDMGAMMGALVLALLPILVFYLCGQKYIIKGVTAGAVKG